mmetsp:Transcript_19418/g.58507  ORF Transcript_19418/g.58507 Transcript_19418/m.58507 type:complete len:200 (+) Transcript_19418:1965-2564(+)
MTSMILKSTGNSCNAVVRVHQSYCTAVMTMSGSLRSSAERTPRARQSWRTAMTAISRSDRKRSSANSRFRQSCLTKTSMASRSSYMRSAAVGVAISRSKTSRPPWRIASTTRSRSLRSSSEAYCSASQFCSTAACTTSRSLNRSSPTLLMYDQSLLTISNAKMRSSQTLRGTCATALWFCSAAARATSGSRLSPSEANS